ncbi:MAG: hypothetical protein JWN37_450 [Candidatus Nomurabacteria bacterium]|nr:hypothetical protein [Candidatus Nomurabacteria bacterium]
MKTFSQDQSLPNNPPEGKRRWIATYHDPKESPFAERPHVITCTADVDEQLTPTEVEQLARNATDKYEFVSVELVE